MPLFKVKEIKTKVNIKITIAFISIHRVGLIKIEAVKNKLALTNSTDLAKVNNLMLNI